VRPDGSSAGRPLAGLQVEAVPAELLDEAGMRRALDGAASVVHSAAMVHVGWRHLDQMRRVNVEGTRIVARAARLAGARMIHVSSVDALGLRPDGVSADEETLPGGMLECPYVVTKREAERVVLPGVGAFGDAMRALHDRGLVEPIVAHVRAEKPFFGICMGLQLLFETGLEGGRHEGLGLLPGEVVRFDLPAGMKVPHMGWNTVEWLAPHPYIRDVPSGTRFYFVHSFAPDVGAETIGSTEHGRPFAADRDPGAAYRLRGRRDAVAAQRLADLRQSVTRSIHIGADQYFRGLIGMVPAVPDVAELRIVLRAWGVTLRRLGCAIWH
jgi:imidazole glycerol phosphate synthase glutamine amidotransferase subunit